MLSPADRVTDCSGFIRAGRRSEHFGSFEEHILGHATVALHHLGRIALEVALQDLENAARVLQRRIGFVLRRTLRFPTAIFAVSASGFGMSRRLVRVLNGSALVQPAFWVVLLFLCIPTGEE